MLTKWDELMCHQLSATMDHVHTDSPEWTERIYVSIYNVRDQGYDSWLRSWPISQQKCAGRICYRVASGASV